MKDQAMIGRKKGKKVKALPTKALSPEKAKTVKGGGVPGESTDDKHPDWLEVRPTK